MLSRFHLILERLGQTDGRTDIIAISILRVSVLTRDKNSSVDEIGERYRMNHAIVVQAACQAVVCRTMCLQAVCLQKTSQLCVYLVPLMSYKLLSLTHKVLTTARSFRYASPRLWNQLPDSFRQPHHSCVDSPPHPLLNSSLSSSTLSSSITPSLFHSRLKTYLFNKSFPP